MLTTLHLRCEYAENPLALDTPAPRLSWQLSAPGRGLAQTAYQVRAASSLESLQAGEADLWDTGKVAASDQMVAYAGRELDSSERAWWQVCAWDQEDEPGPFSPPAWFEFGLGPDDWTAEWIAGPPAWAGRALYFRRDFTIPAPVRRARVAMAGLSWSELSINGRRVNDRVLDPAQTDYSQRILFTTDAVDEFLQAGKNTIGVCAANGWLGSVRLLFQLDLELESGENRRIISQAGWAEPWWVTAGPILSSSVYDGEVYDARLEIPGWDRPEGLADFRGWLNAYGADGTGGRLVPALLEPVRVVETLAPLQATQPAAGVRVVDLGQNIAGWARLRVQGEAGTRVTLRFAESLRPDGTINPENLRTARAEDVYILKGGGEETWEPRFTYHGFRYVQVEGYPGPWTAEALQGRVVRSDLETSGRFESGSPLLNRIHRMIWWTESSNLHSIPTDCPQRDERMGWLNDLAARSEELVHNFDAARLLSKFIADIADEQDPRTGAIADTAPFRWGRRPADPVSVCYLLIPWLLYTHAGDKRVLAEHYDGMRRWVNFLATCAVDGIVEYSYYGDWAPPVGEGVAGSLGDSAVSRSTPGALISTACFAYSARLLAQIALALGKKRDAAAYLRLAEGTAADFNRRFWDAEKGGYGSCNQSCNAIALYMGLVPLDRRDQAVASLIRAVEERDFHLDTGNICTKYLLEALTAAGRVDIAYRIAAQETYPSWGHMLAGGATTLWERWEHATGGGMNSHNHPMLGSVGAWFYRALAGIRAHPGGAGFARFSVRPELPPGLDSAGAELLTVHGKVVSQWERGGDELVLRVVVPIGSQARIALPCEGWSPVYERGRIVWQDEQPVETLTEGLVSAHREGSRVVFEAGSGEYNFRCRV